MVLPNVPVDRIGGQVRKTDYRRALLTIVGGVLYVLGWLPGRALLGCKILATWVKHTWAGSAIRVGFTDGFRPRPSR